MKIAIFLTALFIIWAPLNVQGQDRPNILWLVSEDNSPLVGAYGDEFATTPNIDRLAQQGFLYTHAYANAPVCAPARNTIITGMYSPSNGNQHMRSNFPASELVEFFPKLLRESGYYVTNNAKTDYNISLDQTEGIWDESSNQAHYTNRGENQPFFAIFNNSQSHEGSIHELKPIEELRHDPENINLPPYHPDIQIMRQQWAQYYDNVEDMDTWVGEKLAELEANGELENTIVFYYGDHGGVLPRSKRYVYESGTRVPFVISIPEKFKDLWPKEETGSEVNELISFVDLAPTILSLAGVEIPKVMQGKAFLGEQKGSESDYVHMFRGRMDERYDMMRSTRSNQYRYIRNYMPYRIYGQHVDYLFSAPSMGAWQQACLEGECDEVQQIFWGAKPVEELYDTQNDPWEVKNLAEDPTYNEVLKEMRQATNHWMVEIMDTGVIPEALMMDVSGGKSLYDYFRSNNINVKSWIELADHAIIGDMDYLSNFKKSLSSLDPVQRYWAAIGLRQINSDTQEIITMIQHAVENESNEIIKTVLAEALFNLGYQSESRNVLIDALNSDDLLTRLYVLNAIDGLNDHSEQIQKAVIDLGKDTGTLVWRNFDHRVAIYLLNKWGISPDEVGLEVSRGFGG